MVHINVHWWILVQNFKRARFLLAALLSPVCSLVRCGSHMAKSLGPEGDRHIVADIDHDRMGYTRFFASANSLSCE